MSTTEMGSAAITHLFQEQAGEMTRPRPYNSLPGRRITKPLLYTPLCSTRKVVSSGMNGSPEAAEGPRGFRPKFKGLMVGMILAFLRQGLKVHLCTRRKKHET